MKTLSAGAVLWLWFALMGQPSGDRASGSAPLAELDVAALADTADLTAVVQRYCARCHNERLLRGNLTLEEFVVEAAHERAPTAEKMIRKLRAGMMPPPGQRRPSPDTLLALVETLETVVDRDAARDRNPGSRRFQRLNRAEYERVVRDLLDLEIDASRWLPADTYLGAFDNMADAQGLSTTLLEAYLRAATEVSRIAIGNPAALSKTAKYTNPIDVSQHAWDRIEGAPYGTRGGMVVTHDFPVDGEYVISLETLFGQGTGFQDVDISIDGEGVALLGLEHGGRSTVPIRTEPIFVSGGPAPGRGGVRAHDRGAVRGPPEDAGLVFRRRRGLAGVGELRDHGAPPPERADDHGSPAQFGALGDGEPPQGVRLPSGTARGGGSGGRGGSGVRGVDRDPARAGGVPAAGDGGRSRGAHGLLR